MFKKVMLLAGAVGILIAAQSTPVKAVNKDAGKALKSSTYSPIHFTAKKQPSYVSTDYQKPYVPAIGRDYQANGPTPIRIWALSEGVYASMFMFGPLMWLWYDFNTGTWTPSGPPDTFAYPPSDTAGYGGMFVNLSPLATTTYKFPFFFGHDYERGNYDDADWWPASTNTYPDWANFDTSYVEVVGEGTGVWPRFGITGDSMLGHQISTDYFNTGGIFYNRLRNIEGTPTWDGKLLIVSDDVGPWYSFFADPYGKKLVVWYMDPAGKAVLLVDTSQGVDFYGGTFQLINLSDTLFNQGEATYYYDYVNGSVPFIDRDHKIHYLFFSNDGTNVSPVILRHYYEGRGIVTIDTIGDGNVYYSVHINTTLAGRGQMGQRWDNGALYAVYEEFIQEPGNFVTASTGDTLAPTRIVLIRSVDVAGGYTTWEVVDTLVQSGLNATFPGTENHWFRYPVMSPFVVAKADTDLVIWGVYEDYDPGFQWQGVGDYSEVDFIVGFTKVYPTDVSERPGVKTEYMNLTAFLNYLKNGNVELVVNLPAEGPLSVKVFDISGKLVNTLNFNGKAGRNVLPVSMKNLANGIYFANVNYRGQNLIKKFVITK
jgi:hypothetical protein